MTIDQKLVNPIRIVEEDGNIFSLDNRRLKAFQDAGVDIPYQKVEYNEKLHKLYFTTENDGSSVKVRGQ